MTPFNEAVLRCLSFILRRLAVLERDHKRDLDSRDCQCEPCELLRDLERESAT